MEKNQFDLLMLAINGIDKKFSEAFSELKIEIAGINNRLDRSEVRFERIEKKLDATIEQTAQLTVRVKQLEGPIA